MSESRELIERLLRENQVVYGVNTGFGKLSDIHIAPAQLHHSNSTWSAVTPADSAIRYRKKKREP
jgi:histidine ammonia-lyase